MILSNDSSFSDDYAKRCCLGDVLKSVNMGDEGFTTMITEGTAKEERSQLTARELLTIAGAVRSTSSSKNQQSDNSTPAADDEEKLLLNAADLSLGHNGSEPSLRRRLNQLSNGDFIVGRSAVVGDIIYTRNKFSSSDLDQSIHSDSSTLCSHPENISIIQSSKFASEKDDNPATIEAPRGVGEWVDLGASFVAHARLAMLYHSRCVQKVAANDAAASNDNSHHNGTSSCSGRSNSEIDISSSNEMKVIGDIQLAEAAAAVAMKVYRIVFCSKALEEEDMYDENEADVVSEEGGREGAPWRPKAAKISDLKTLYTVLKRKLFNKLCDAEDSNSNGDDSCGYTHGTAHKSEQSSPTDRGHIGRSEGQRLRYSKEFMKDVRRSMQVADLLPKQRGGKGKKKASFTEGFNRIEEIVNTHRVHFDTDIDTGSGGRALPLAGQNSIDGSDASELANMRTTASTGSGAGDGAAKVSGHVSTSSSSGGSTGLCSEECDGTAGDCSDDDGNESCSEEERENGKKEGRHRNHDQSAVGRDGTPPGRTGESNSNNNSTSSSKSIDIGGSIGVGIGLGDRGRVGSSGTDRVAGSGFAALPLKGNKKDRRNALRLQKFGAPKAPLPAL
jgi:hypothetical protein